MRTLLIQSQYLRGDYAGVPKELLAELQAAENAAARAPAEDRLKLLLNAALQAERQRRLRAGRWSGWSTYYPKKEYWVDLLGRLQRKPNFRDRLALDIYRLSLATGSMTAANDYMEMAQLAVQAGLPAEAQAGAATRASPPACSAAGAEAERHQRLRDLVAKRLAEEQGTAARTPSARRWRRKDGNALVRRRL